MAAAANMFSVRIVTADYYMASPLPGLDICQSPLTQLPVKKVPVVRVFGATPAGKRERAGAGARASERAPGRRGCPPRRALARTPPALSGVAAEASLLSALLAFSPARDRRRKKKKMWVRASAAPPPRQRGGGRRVSALRAAGGRAGWSPSLGGSRGCASSQGRVRGSSEVAPRLGTPLPRRVSLVPRSRNGFEGRGEVSGVLSVAPRCLCSPSLSSAPAGDAVAVESGARGHIIFLIEVTMWLFCECQVVTAWSLMPRRGQSGILRCNAFRKCASMEIGNYVFVSPNIKYYT